MINYNLIDQSIQFYQKNHFDRIESPWTVSVEIDDLTRPKDKIPFELKHNNKRLVASGEQSFLYLYLKDFLPKGQFQTITPCFRYEEFDFLHTKYFIKNELIKTDKVDDYECEKMIDMAFNFFSSYFEKSKLSITKADTGFDIEVNGYELGSYGIRESKFLKWIYGTGCAEPRLSKLIGLYGISH